MSDDIPPEFRPFVVGSGRKPGQSPGTRARGRSSVRWRDRAAIGAVGVVVLVMLFAPFAARRVTDWLWYREIGFERVFVTRIVAQWALVLSAGIGCFALFYANARAALRGLVLDAVAPVDRARGGSRAQAAFLARFADVLALPASALLAILVALLAGTEWRALAQFFYRTPFGFTDPVFGRDVAYYVFTLPVLEMVIDYASLALTLSLALIAVPIYVARGDVGRSWPFRLAKRAEAHLAVLGALLLAVVGLRMIVIEVPALLQSTHAPLQGASYTDLNVRLITLRILGMLALAGAGLLLWAARHGRLVRDATFTVGAYVVTAMVLVGLVPSVFQRLVVQPNELARETPQILHHIAGTRAAWGVDRVELRELGAQRQLSFRDIEANQATIANVRLWDREPLLQTFGQIQAIRTYYDFVAVDDDRYRIGGDLRQVMLSARELNTTSLPTRSFVNEHLTFTHGMGLTLGPSNQVTAEGLPVLWIKDLPPSSTIGAGVTRPQIYFGELANDFILAPTSQRELDYPAGEGDAAVYSTYAGTAGVPIGSFGRRLLFALRFQSLNILFSRNITPETRILFHRSITTRAQLALPFLRFDRDPYLVITDAGELKWILDAYTTTDRFPYSQRLTDGTNYMRNSVKVVIDAYDGDVQAYLADPDDPMIRTLSRIYPGLLRPLPEMPADLRAHLRYPEDLFRAQTAIYATFHMTNPETFYHREDQWQVPLNPSGEGSGFIRHMVMRLPGEGAPEFILMRPFTPRQKDNLAAWMVARNDGEHYGKLVAYRFPRQSLVFGPTQIVNRISQDTEVSRQIALWDQGGSEVIRGELLVIPIEESLLYVQPLYLRSQGGRIPELKRVIVAHENRVAMDSTLDAGLERLFAGGPRVTGTATVPGAEPTAGAGESGAVADLVRRALQHYERARAAQRSDDWAAYGNEMRQLGEILRRLEAARVPR
jgi:uncharacterized membrane protein (UPF0182 family)